jgi:hypothetical protein
MDELRRHLQHDPAAVFRPSELNHILLMVYNFLEAAVRDRCDMLRFTPHNITWSRGGLPVHQFQLGPAPRTTTFRAELERILARDAVVRRHLRLVAATPAEVTYRIAADGQPPAGVAGVATDGQQPTTDR